MYVSLPRASCRHRVQQRRLDLPGRRISANAPQPAALAEKERVISTSPCTQSRPVHALSPAGGYGTRVVAAPVSSRAPLLPPANRRHSWLAPRAPGCRTTEACRSALRLGPLLGKSLPPHADPDTASRARQNLPNAKPAWRGSSLQSPARISFQSGIVLFRSYRKRKGGCAPPHGTSTAEFEQRLQRRTPFLVYQVSPFGGVP